MRILIVDDEPAMHDSYRRCFAPVSSAPHLNAMATELFGEDAGIPEVCSYDIVHCTQGLEAAAAVEEAVASGDPFAVAFIDIRMPPGIDGRETAARIRTLDAAINLVIVTGYSDFAPIEIARSAGPVDKLFYIAKPFEAAEVVQTAQALTHRWQADRALAEAMRKLEGQAVELAANESKALHLATHDSLTDAPNRLAFVKALSERPRAGGMFAVAMVDLDRFKLVNDTLGHLAGDELLRAVYHVLKGAAPADALVARLGGDEFGVLFDTIGEPSALHACERMLAACASNFRIMGHSVQAAASAGIVVVESDSARDPVDVMRRADLALHHSKKAARGTAHVFDETMDEGVRFRRRVEGGLSQAIERGELDLVYQPIVAEAHAEVVGFEALLRWRTAEFGPISPALFIPIAEESNLIHELGDWVLGEALKVLDQWPGQYVSVNFSPRQFRRPNFVAHVVERVARAGIEPGRLQIEITETAIFDDAERAAETLYKLRQMGFRIALDDFGTGYSSLYNIRKFALDSLKIDKSFIQGMGRERESAAIVQSIVHLARALGLSVIAEGVETEAQVLALRLIGASHVQGYYFARPLSPELAREIAHERFIGGGDDTDGDEFTVQASVEAA